MGELRYVWRQAVEGLSRVELLLLAYLLALNAVSIFGYGTFGIHPELVARWTWAGPIFNLAYPVFAQLQIVVAWAVFQLVLHRRSGWRWLPAFAATFVLSLASEWAGTTYGIPFGKYEYTALLGPKLLDKVPWLIPVSWFFMGLASYGVVVRLQGTRLRSAIFRIVAGAVLLTSWDLSLDPAMSHLTPFWLWENPGWYYGMPELNLFGWFVTGLVIMAAFELLGGEKLVAGLPRNFALVFYLANLMLPFGMCVVAELWLAALVTLVVSAIFAWIGWSAARPATNF